MKERMGTRIAELRKAHGLTQAQLAEQMGVTDKAVSKWERNLSCPDIGSIPHLAEVLEIPVEELMEGGQKQSGKAGEIVRLILRAVPLAMGIAVTVLTILNQLDTKSAMIMLGLGLASGALYLLENRER